MKSVSPKKLNTNFFIKIGTTLGLLGLGCPSFAGEFHHKSILIGERAAGLGGAFTAISDDPSGVYYNPAGLAFSFENYISLSANAWAANESVFKNVVTGQDYKLVSNSLIPSFFGFSQSLGNNKIALGIIVPNSELIDQNDTLSNFASDTTTTTSENYLSRRYFKQDDTYLIGPAYAREIADNLSAGISVFYAYRIVKSIDNQIVAFNPVPTGKYFMSNSYVDFSTKQITPRVGLQWMPFPKLSIGAASSMDFDMGGQFKLRSVATNYTETTNADGSKTRTYVTQNGVFNNDLLSTESAGAYLPANLLKSSLGSALFFSKEFLISADLDLIYPLNSGLHKTTLNWAVGSEYFVSESFPFRLGVYSNNSSLSPAQIRGEFTTANLIGITGGFSWITPGSSFTLTGSYAFGSGRGKITTGGTGSQAVEMDQVGVYIMGSYQL